MNEPENDPQNASRLMDMNENYEALRRQSNLMFIGLVVTSFTLTVFLGLQAKRAAAELSVIKPAAVETAKAVQQNDANVQALFTKLTEFGRTLRMVCRRNVGNTSSTRCAHRNGILFSWLNL